MLRMEGRHTGEVRTDERTPRVCPMPSETLGLMDSCELGSPISSLRGAKRPNPGQKCKQQVSYACASHLNKAEPRSGPLRWYSP